MKSKLAGDADNKEVSRSAVPEYEDSRAYFNFAPWSMDLSLKEKATEVGVEYTTFIEGLRLHREDREMAEEFGVPEGMIRNLREHFEKEIGLNCIMGF